MPSTASRAHFAVLCWLLLLAPPGAGADAAAVFRWIRCCVVSELCACVQVCDAHRERSINKTTTISTTATGSRTCRCVRRLEWWCLRSAGFLTVRRVSVICACRVPFFMSNFVPLLSSPGVCEHNSYTTIHTIMVVTCVQSSANYVYTCNEY